MVSIEGEKAPVFIEVRSRYLENAHPVVILNPFSVPSLKEGEIIKR